LRIQTLFFAAYKDLLGLSRLEVEVPEGCTISQLVSALRQRGGAFLALPQRPAVAVNRSYSYADSILSAGDEVAFIPPVAGG
jgi:molybdopterin synthase catalytic subunit